MRVAAIDIGTNSVRLLIATLEGKTLVNKEKALSMTRIGKDVDATMMLREDRMQATIEALIAYKEKVDALGIKGCPVFATSAVRDAKNREDFIARVKAATGFDVNVIPGDLEAELGFLGVVSGSGALAMQGNSLIIDIGGGSTELIIGTEKGQIVSAHSLNIGAVRLTDRHMLKHQSSWSEFRGLIEDVETALEPILPMLTREPIAVAFGIGGTATTLGAMSLQLQQYNSQAVHLAEVTKDQVYRMACDLIEATLDQKLEMKGLMAKRADIIAAGAVILYTILRRLELNCYVVSDDDNLEGALYHQLSVK